jgi:predicted dehydrogenase
MDGFSYNQGGHYDAPDFTTLQMIFESDCFFNGLWSFNANERDVEDTCHIMGERGSLRFSFFSNQLLTVALEDEQTTLHLPNPPHIQQPMIEQAMAYFRGDAENPCSLAEAMLSMHMMDATNDQQ